MGESRCVGGDFNVTSFPGEINKDGRILGPMRRFS